MPSDTATVPNKPLREAFEASGMKAHALALNAGVTRRYQRVLRDGTLTGSYRVGGDGTAVLRDLGIKPHPSGSNRKRYVRTRLAEHKAKKFAELLGLDPVDVGL